MTDRTRRLVSHIVISYLKSNSLTPDQVSALIDSVHTTIRRLSGANNEIEIGSNPAVPIKQSITPEYLICLEDGLKFKSLKRHIGTKYGLTPDEYRKRWGLPPQYPMVAPNYAKLRSSLAKTNGLGQRRTNVSDDGQDNSTVSSI